MQVTYFIQLLVTYKYLSISWIYFQLSKNDLIDNILRGKFILFIRFGKNTRVILNKIFELNIKKKDEIR